MEPVQRPHRFPGPGNSLSPCKYVFCTWTTGCCNDAHLEPLAGPWKKSLMLVEVLYTLSFLLKMRPSLLDEGLATARTCRVRSDLYRNLPEFDPMLQCLHSDHRPGPSTGAVRIKPVRISYFQILLQTRARGSKGISALRAGE